MVTRCRRFDIKPEYPWWMWQSFKMLPVFLFVCLCVSCLTVAENHWIQRPNPFTRIVAPTAIPTIATNLSGITWHPERHSFFAITNSPQIILELDVTGKTVRCIQLEGFSDTEDIVHLEGSRFAVVEERLGQIRIIEITDSTTLIHAASSIRIDLGTRHPDNKGFECLGFDRTTQTLLTMREKPPFILLRIPLHPDGKIGTTQTEAINMRIVDVAGLSVGPDGDLWILSEASSCILRMRHGHEILRVAIATDHSLQPEGLAFDDHGNLIVVGEPNLLCMYQPKTSQ